METVLPEFCLRTSSRETRGLWAACEAELLDETEDALFLTQTTHQLPVLDDMGRGHARITY